MGRFHQAALTAILFFLILTPQVQALELMTYNILNFSSGRTAEFQAILAETNPDILVVQEILYQSAVDGFLANVLNYNDPGEWAAGDFHNGYDTDNAIFYKTAKVQYLSHTIINTTLREIDEWTIRPVGYTSEEANLRIYVVHLKASQGTDNENRRLNEVQSMRARMESFPVGQNYIVTGDFNIYDSGEPAYIYMLGSTGGPAGIVEDPIDAPGNWHNSYSFAYLHTQSPRTTSFGGGATGGMDDRFDMILSSPALRDGSAFEIIPGTYTPFGNDGNHYNKALTDPPTNPYLPAAVIQALHDASDHLPVTVELSLPAILLAEDQLDLGTTIVGAAPSAPLIIENGATDPADNLSYTLDAPFGFSAPSGQLEAAPDDGPLSHTITLLTASQGAWGGNLVVSTDAPDAPSFSVSLSATVLAHAQPTIADDQVVVSGAIDFGTNQPAMFEAEDAIIYNFDHSSLQAALEIYDASLTGDPRFSFTTGFTPATATSDPVAWSLTFDATGAPDGPYGGTVVFHTRDQQDLDGAALLSDLTFELFATVDSESSDVETPDEPHFTGLAPNEPNPFTKSTRLTYHLANTEMASLVIYDISGRAVRTLLSGMKDGGSYHLEWDGLDDNGQDLGTGIFYTRLATERFKQTRIITRIR